MSVEMYAIHAWSDGSRVSFHLEAEAETVEVIDMLRPIVVRGLGEVLGLVSGAEVED